MTNRAVNQADGTSGADANGVSRRDFMRQTLRVSALTGGGALAGALSGRAFASTHVWQIQPERCLWCENCATQCVLEPSAVKCVQLYPICGYCELCTGYFIPQPYALNTGAENQVCPTAAIQRSYVEDPYFEYHIDESLCIGCARCVEGCTLYGNGSFYLQVRHDRCVDCNECAIARSCPGDAFIRTPAETPYLKPSWAG